MSSYLKSSTKFVLVDENLKVKCVRGDVDIREVRELIRILGELNMEIRLNESVVILNGVILVEDGGRRDFRGFAVYWGSRGRNAVDLLKEFFDEFSECLESNKYDIDDKHYDILDQIYEGINSDVSLADSEESVIEESKRIYECIGEITYDIPYERIRFVDVVLRALKLGRVRILIKDYLTSTPPESGCVNVVLGGNKISINEDSNIKYRNKSIKETFTHENYRKIFRDIILVPLVDAFKDSGRGKRDSLMKKLEDLSPYITMGLIKKVGGKKGWGIPASARVLWWLGDKYGAINEMVDSNIKNGGTSIGSIFLISLIFSFISYLFALIIGKKLIEDSDLLIVLMVLIYIVLYIVIFKIVTSGSRAKSGTSIKEEMKKEEMDEEEMDVYRDVIEKYYNYLELKGLKKIVEEAARKSIVKISCENYITFADEVKWLIGMKKSVIDDVNKRIVYEITKGGRKWI